ncbi:MAG TPA: hypothetical protein VF316_04790, partial [Polyangiaceae bacterium]
ADKLLTCSNPFTEGGYAIGESTDEGATVRPIAQFADVAGPVPCDGGAGEKCQGHEWREMHATLTTPTASPSASAAPVSDASSALPDAGRAPPEDGTRCTCGGVGHPGGIPFGALLVPLLAFARRRARRRAVDRSSSSRTVHLRA